MFNFYSQKNKGMSLIEVVIGLAIISTSFFAVFSAYNFFIKVAVRNAEATKVNFLVEEGVEAVRSIRDSGWDDFYALSTSTDYYLLFDAGSWIATTSNIYLEDRFERKFIVSKVYRDFLGDVSDNSGTLDEGIRKVDISVSWSTAGATSTVSIETYLANLYEE